MDPMRLYVIFDPACTPGPAWVAMVDRAFSSLGMQRDDRLFGVPVQQRSAPWGGGQPGLPNPRHPRQIDLSNASCNCLMVLVDAVMVRFNQAQWAEYMGNIQSQMAQRPGRDIVVPVLLHDEDKVPRTCVHADLGAFAEHLLRRTHPDVSRHGSLA